MNREEFVNKINHLNEAIKIVEHEKANLKQLYIQECCPYEVGDKVKITTPNWRGGFTEDVGYVEHIKASEDGSFIPDCAACKKDGTKHARNKLYISYNSVITKFISEDDMKLEDYSTDQLREELKRRAYLARAAARQAGSNKPTYVTTEGIVKKILLQQGPFCHKKWVVEVSEEFAKENQIQRELTYALRGGAFTKDTAPKVGDKVVLRCRITKRRTRFNQGDARITDINNDD
mgnify:CR=1 FL=1